jgi:hypothetical protein
MKLSKGSDQSYDLNYSPNETKEGNLRPPTYHYTSPHAIFLGITSGTQSIFGPFTLGYFWQVQTSLSRSFHQDASITAIAQIDTDKLQIILS